MPPGNQLCEAFYQVDGDVSALVVGRGSKKGARFPIPFDLLQRHEKPDKNRGKDSERHVHAEYPPPDNFFQDVEFAR